MERARVPGLGVARELSSPVPHSSLDTRRAGLFTLRNMKSGPLVAVIMGSKSDWETMKHAVDMLVRFGIPHDARVVSAHRTPDWMVKFAREAEGKGIQVIIAGAGGAAHLPGMVAALTHLPVLGVPVQSRALKGLDSLLSIAQMPAGIPVGTLAIGEAGAKNAGLLAAGIIALHDERVRKKLVAFRRKQTAEVLAQKLS
jgi:5-(carboxyamino)imidazole ribonucleotide mutase